jgi:hypothetical protein
MLISECQPGPSVTPAPCGGRRKLPRAWGYSPLIEAWATRARPSVGIAAVEVNGGDTRECNLTPERFHRAEPGRPAHHPKAEGGARADRCAGARSPHRRRPSGRYGELGRAGLAVRIPGDRLRLVAGTFFRGPAIRAVGAEKRAAPRSRRVPVSGARLAFGQVEQLGVGHLRV